MTSRALSDVSVKSTPTLFRRSAILVTLSMIAYGMGQTVVYTLVPPLARGLSLNEVQIGFMTSCAAVFAVICAPLWGKASDRFGRGAVMAICIVLYSVTNGAFALTLGAGVDKLITGSTLFAALVASRSLFGAGSVGLQPAAAALMADVSAQDRRGSAMAYIGLGLGLGMIFGPLYAVALSGFGVVPSLLVLSLVPLPLILPILLLPRTKPVATGDRSLRIKPYDPRLLPVVILAVTTYVGVAMLQQTIAFLVQDRLRLATATEAAGPVGTTLGGFAVAMLIAQIAMTRAGAKRPMIYLRFATLLMAAGFALLLIGEDMSWLLAGMVVVGLGFGIAGPNLLAAASERVSAEYQGAVAGVMSAAPALSFVIGPVLSGALYARADWLPFAALVGVNAAAAVLAAATPARRAEETL